MEQLKPCKLAKKCGGCQLQDMTYEEQLQLKQKNVNQLLKKYGKVDKIIGMDNPYNYRNKVQHVFGIMKGTPISGVYAEKTHAVINVDSCQIEDKKADEIIVSVRSLLKSFKIKTYNEDTGYGLLRHVLVKTARNTGEIMVVLVLGSPVLPSKNNFVKALRKIHPEISTIIVNVNSRNTSMVLGNKSTTIYGKGYIEDILCGCRFRISPSSFYQVNPVQTEVLYGRAIELAGLTGKEKIIDTYCGIGTIGIIASRQASKCISVELNRDAIKDARINAKINDIKNVDFYNNDAGKFMVELADAGEDADVVFMDPPRAGSDEAFLSSLMKLAPKKIVYISCNPVTLARDLEYITQNKYRVSTITPVDMFPFTNHVETVVLLTKVTK